MLSAKHRMSNNAQTWDTNEISRALEAQKELSLTRSAES